MKKSNLIRDKFARL